MASIFTHAAVPFLALRFLKKNSWKLVLLSAFTAVMPDLDVIMLKFVSYASVWGHRGFTHGFFFGALWSVFLVFAFFATSTRKQKLWLGLWFFIVHFSHSFLDSITNGGLGVGYFTPFMAHRYFFPWRPLIVSPLDTSSFFSMVGVKIMISEITIVVLPMLFAGFVYRLWKRQWQLGPARVALVGSVVLAEFCGLYILSSVDRRGSVFSFENNKVILRDIGYGQPGHAFAALPERHFNETVISNIEHFKEKELINRKIMVSERKRGWGSPFFPNWYGGVAGRWQDSNTSLLLRTVFGFNTYRKHEILSLLEKPEQNFDVLYELSPAEKYDLAMGDYAFTATRDMMKITHNRQDVAKDYFGICNGVAFASINLPEPVKRVQVVNPDGYKVEFHPNDIKALVSQAYYNVNTWKSIAGGCGWNLSCNINPALFITSVVNSIGRHGRPLVVDVHPGKRAQFYPLIGYEFEIERYLDEDEITDTFHLMPNHKGQKIAVARIQIIMNSTIMSNEEISELKYDSRTREYDRVGVREVVREYKAYLGMNARGELLSGEWIKTGGFFPDILAYSVDNTVTRVHRHQLASNSHFRWDIIEGLYVRSLNGRSWHISDYLDTGVRNYAVHNGVCFQYNHKWNLIRQWDMSRTTASRSSIPVECRETSKSN